MDASLPDASILPLGLDPLGLAAIFAAVAAAYVIFGIAGFGTALVAGPVLAHFVPLSVVVPLLALLDFTAAGLNVARNAAAADLGELRRIVPPMLLGSAAGAAILLLGRPGALQLALGLFAAGQAANGLRPARPQTRYRPGAALPFGLVGGVFSALFGSGGFLYAIYLAGRLEGAERIRTTQSLLIGLSTLARALMFLAAGVYGNAGLLALAALLVPAMLAGLAIGRRISLRMPRARFLRLLNLVVLASGLALILRWWQSLGAL